MSNHRARARCPIEKVIFIHDGLCPCELYPGVERRSLAYVLERFTDRFELVEVCECGAPVWAAIVPTERVRELLHAVRWREG